MSRRSSPNLWVPFEDGASFGQWLDNAKTQRNLEELNVSKKDIAGHWAYEHLFDEIRKRLRTRGRDTWVGDTPTREALEDLLHGEQTMIDILFHASIADVLDDHLSDQRLKDALFGQGVIAAYGSPPVRVRARQLTGDPCERTTSAASVAWGESLRRFPPVTLKR